MWSEMFQTHQANNATISTKFELKFKPVHVFKAKAKVKLNLQNMNKMKIQYLKCSVLLLKSKQQD